MNYKAKGDENLIDRLIHKHSLKVQVHDNTVKTFELMKESAHRIFTDNQKKVGKSKKNIPFEYRDRGDFQFELRFGSDVLIFMLHTNVFEFDRNHQVQKTPYVKEDIERSYCGLIQVYNFLSDSFKYNRVNDLGYLIARIFVNKDMHYFIEGKREIGLLYNSFAVAEMNKATAEEIVESAMSYSINFDLLTPPFDDVKMATVNEVVEYFHALSLKTGKRLGFKFQADKQ